MLRLALKHEKVSHSVLKEATEFVGGMDLDLETKFDVEMKSTEKTRKLKRIDKKKEKKAIDST